MEDIRKELIPILFNRLNTAHPRDPKAFLLGLRDTYLQDPQWGKGFETPEEYSRLISWVASRWDPFKKRPSKAITEEVTVTEEITKQEPNTDPGCLEEALMEMKLSEMSQDIVDEEFKELIKSI
jgi:hypothetical protein